MEKKRVYPDPPSDLDEDEDVHSQVKFNTEKKQKTIVTVDVTNEDIDVILPAETEVTPPTSRFDPKDQLPPRREKGNEKVINSFTHSLYANDDCITTIKFRRMVDYQVDDSLNANDKFYQHIYHQRYFSLYHDEFMNRVFDENKLIE